MITRPSRSNRILIIEEDPTALELLKDYVAAHGWTSVTARSGDEALRSFSIGMFDLVLADADLREEMTGIELVDTLHEIDPRLNIAMMNWPTCGADSTEESEPEIEAPMAWPDVDALLDGRASVTA
jgi:CheY-like chemotaxis protein